MQYDIIDQKDFFHITLSGKPIKNEILQTKRMLLPLLNKKGVHVIIDLQDLQDFQAVDSLFLFGILNSIRKEISFLGGDMMLCSLDAEMLQYFQQNRLNKIFDICKDKENAEESEWRQHDG